MATFNHADRLGSVVAESSGGTLTGQYKYDAWGQSATLTGTGFGYAGYRYDAETGLYYVRARYLDPRLGRFVSPDPLGQKPSLNVYGYAAGDPLNQIDPLGLTSGFLSGSADTDSSLIQSAANFVSNHPLASLAVIATVAIGGGPEDPVTDAIAADEIAAAEEAGGLANAAEGLAPRAPDFVVTPGGDVIPVPEGATGPVPTNSPGFQFNGGAGGNGLAPNVTDVRIMEPNAQNPTGYVNYGSAQSNGGWQSVNPYTGQSIPPSNPWWHIPINTGPWR